MQLIMKTKILVVDDDLRLRELLKRYLTDQGYAVETVPDATSMERSRTRERFDLLVLDLMLPGEDGLAICRRLRGAKDDIAIIMLTAKGDDIDRIVGLEMGADDYLPKPFNPRELAARIQSVLRRKQPIPTPGAPDAIGSKVEFGSFILDLGTRALTKDGQPVSITSGEFALLKVLATHPREPLSREKLTELARGREHGPFDRGIDIQISRLRRLIEPEGADPAFIQTVWGFGYVFIPEGRPA
jgi:two-component system, OmpR family, phosphate regulon response regulator OmpR